ncbi:MAG: hypothetical protein ACLQM8_19165 [Limisphaerales bacterium]
MKKNLLFSVIALGLLALVLPGCRSTPPPPPPPAPAPTSTTERTTTTHEDTTKTIQSEPVIGQPASPR